MKDLDYSHCVLLGGGGHAAVLIDAILAGGLARPQAILEPDESRWGEDVFGVPIVGGDELLPELVERGASHFAVGIGSTGETSLRQDLFAYGLQCGIKPRSIIHPTAILSRSVELGRGTQLLAGVIVNTRAILGDNVIVNTASIVEHDCVVESHAHLATGARLCGNVIVGRGAHIGAGATVRQGIKIGNSAIVGAGSVVVKDIPDDTIVVGVPARALIGPLHS